MDLFPQYRPTQDGAIQHLDRTRLLGLIPIFLSLVLMGAVRGLPGPGLWCAFGTAVGLQIILSSARLASVSARQRRRTTDPLIVKAEVWVPLLLFGVQTGFAVITVLLLWLTLGDLNYRMNALQHGLLFSLLVFFPAHRLAVEAARQGENPARVRLEGFLRYVKRSLLAVWTALFLTEVLRDPSGKIGEGTMMLVIGLWIFTALFVLTCLAFLLDRIAGRGRAPQSI